MVSSRRKRPSGRNVRLTVSVAPLPQRRLRIDREARPGTDWSSMTHLAARIAYRLTASLVGLIISYAAHSSNINTLRPLDTSSPRATLQGFVTAVDGLYIEMKDILEEYEASNRLYLTSAERRTQFEALSLAPKAIKALDLSDVPPVLRETIG